MQITIDNLENMSTIITVPEIQLKLIGKFGGNEHENQGTGNHVEI